MAARFRFEALASAATGRRADVLRGNVGTWPPSAVNGRAPLQYHTTPVDYLVSDLYKSGVATLRRTRSR